MFYHPDSQAENTAFFDDFDEVLDSISTFARPVMLMGDLNHHLVIETNPNTVKFNTTIKNHCLLQHVASCTHRAGYLLDVFITRLDCSVHTVDIAPPELSDHSFIKMTVDLQFQHILDNHCIRRRQWRAFDFNGFCDDLSSSAILCNPPIDAVGLFTSYHNTMQVLVDKHASFAVVKRLAHSTAPWYEHKCHSVKLATRKLERAYRRDKWDANRTAWRQQLRLLCFIRGTLIIGQMQ